MVRPIDLIQTVGVPTNHHDLVQLPNGNFLLTAMLTLPATPGAQTCRRQNAAGTYPSITSDFVLRAIVQEVTPAGALVRDWDSTGEFNPVTETTVPICFQVPAATGDDYLSSFHPNAIDLKANGPGTADDQLIVSARHADAVYGINFDDGDRRLEARRYPEA